MKSLTTAATAGLLAAVLGLTVAGCSTATETRTAEETSAAQAAATDADAVDRVTLNRYIEDSEIAEYPIKPGDPGTPEIDFPIPPGWRIAGDEKPDWAYGAIIYDEAVDPDDPPFIYAIAVKLTGDADPAKILEYAPGQLNDFPEFTPLGEPETNSFDGYDAIDYIGTYVLDGETRAVGQRTIVIPGKDELFVLQLNAEAPEGQEDVVVDAIKIIADQTTITLPA
jgi:hypothetical protein